MSRFTNLQTLQTGQKNVTTATTPVQLGTGIVPDGVSILVKAKAANTGRINVANSSANALTANGVYFGLTANQSVSLQVSDLSAVWLDCSVNGEGVEWIAEKG